MRLKNCLYLKFIFSYYPFRKILQSKQQMRLVLTRSIEQDALGKRKYAGTTRSLLRCSLSSEMAAMDRQPYVIALLEQMYTEKVNSTRPRFYLLRKSWGTVRKLGLRIDQGCALYLVLLYSSHWSQYTSVYSTLLVVQISLVKCTLLRKNWQMLMNRLYQGTLICKKSQGIHCSGLVQCTKKV